LSNVLPGEASGEGDLIAQEAGVGALQYNDGRQEIQIVAEESPGDAEAVAKQYEIWGPGDLEQVGTVVLAATTEMSDAERDGIKECLSEQGITD
jgi:hypothetical protein